MTTTADPQAASTVKALVEPWHAAVSDPAKAQEEVFGRLLDIYAQTLYGKQHGAEQVDGVVDYRKAFPVGTYDHHFKPLIMRVMKGEVDLLLAALLSQGEVVAGVLQLPGVTRDPKDDPLVACAVEGRANYLVSGDRDLLDLGEYEGIQMVTPRGFLDILGS